MKLFGDGRVGARDRAKSLRAMQSGNISNHGPGLEGLGPDGSQLEGGERITAEVKEVVDQAQRKPGATHEILLTSLG